jgi:hypothetical protein
LPANLNLRPGRVGVVGLGRGANKSQRDIWELP